MRCHGTKLVWFSSILPCEERRVESRYVEPCFTVCFLLFLLFSLFVFLHLEERNHKIWKPFSSSLCFQLTLMYVYFCFKWNSAYCMIITASKCWLLFVLQHLKRVISALGPYPRSPGARRIPNGCKLLHKLVKFGPRTTLPMRHYYR